MGRYGVGDAVRVLVSWSVLADQAGTVLDVVINPASEELYLVKFPDRFMRYFSESELGPISDTGSN